MGNRQWDGGEGEKMEKREMRGEGMGRREKGEGRREGER